MGMRGLRFDANSLNLSKCRGENYWEKKNYLEFLLEKACSLAIFYTPHYYVPNACI